MIELVVVIVILGVLAAVSIARFAPLASSANTAVLDDLAVSVSSAANLARGLAMTAGSPATITMEGTTVSLLYNYPDASATGIGAAVNYSPSDFRFTPTSDGIQPAAWAKLGAPGVCAVFYSPPASLGGTPTITTYAAGC
jgi:MSHA pilin protein MshA